MKSYLITLTVITLLIPTDLIAQKKIARFDILHNVPFTDLSFDLAEDFVYATYGQVGVGITLNNLYFLELGGGYGIGDSEGDIYFGKVGLTYQLNQKHQASEFEFRIPLLFGLFITDTEYNNLDTTKNSEGRFETGIQATYWYSQLGYTIRLLIGAGLSRFQTNHFDKTLDDKSEIKFMLSSTLSLGFSF